MRRLLAGAVLLAVLFGLCLHYGAVQDRHDPYPSAAELVADYDGHVGEPFYAWARIVDVGPDAMSFEVRSGTASIRLRVPERPPGVAVGDVVQVYGTLEPDRTVRPERLVVSPRTGLTYLYAVSALGALLTAGLGVRRWRVDRSRWALVPREGRRDA